MSNITIDAELATWLGDSLSPDEEKSKTASTIALGLLNNSHGQISNVIRACKKSPYFRWVVADLIINHYKKSKAGNEDYLIFESIAAVFGAVESCLALSTIPPLNKDYPDFICQIHQIIY